MDSLPDSEYDEWQRRKPGMAPLGLLFVRAARRNPFSDGFSDASRGTLSYIKALTGAIAVARALRPNWGTQERVGILLPPTVAGALVNMAAAITSRVTVNLNYTTGKAGMESAARLAGLKTVVTSRQFMKKAGLEPPEGVEVIWLEDVAKTIGSGERLRCLLLACTATYAGIERATGARERPSIDDDSTIIFSSGSTGEPKGVRLSHFNVISNAIAAGEVLRVDHHDQSMHLLPFFHAFGNVMLWTAIFRRAGLVFLPDPLDAHAVGELTDRHAGTILSATPTFLQLYMKRVAASKFRTLRILVAGAEKLTPKVESALHKHFGAPVLEGYGCTECSPVIAVNGPGRGHHKSGTVGRPLPGVRVRVVDPDFFRPLEAGMPGMLLVRGPSVMEGYLDRDDLTAKVMRDGWYVTGDIGTVDEEGFVSITDRLSRFSKIGGEMVPHMRIEEALGELVESETQVFAVTSVSDARRGESIAVVHIHDESRIEELCRALGNTDLPKLFIPKPSFFIRVDELPLLGTGKLDLRALKRIAAERLLRSEF